LQNHCLHRRLSYPRQVRLKSVLLALARKHPPPLSSKYSLCKPSFTAAGELMPNVIAYRFVYRTRGRLRLMWSGNVLSPALVWRWPERLLSVMLAASSAGESFGTSSRGILQQGRVDGSGRQVDVSDDAASDEDILDGALDMGLALRTRLVETVPCADSAARRRRLYPQA
jgi:hypothetical protein